MGIAINGCAALAYAEARQNKEKEGANRCPPHEFPLSCSWRDAVVTIENPGANHPIMPSRCCHLKLGIILSTVAFRAQIAAGQQYTAIEIDPTALGGSNSIAEGINNIGHVVGSYVASNGVEHANRWINGVMTDLSPDTDRVSVAFAINDAGVIVGEAEDLDGDTLAFRWVSPGPMLLVTIFGNGAFDGFESTALMSTMMDS